MTVLLRESLHACFEHAATALDLRDFHQLLVQRNCSTFEVHSQQQRFPFWIVFCGQFCGFKAFGIEPKPLGLFLEDWMVPYRKHGRFGAANERAKARKGG